MNILKRACDKQLGKNTSKSGGKVRAQLRDVSNPSPTRSAWREQSAKGCVAPAPFAYAPKGLDAPALGTEVFLSYVVPNHYNAVAAQEAPRESAEVKK